MAAQDASAFPADDPELPPSGGAALPAVPPDCPSELAERMGADVLAKVERRWPRRRHELGACLVWTGPQVEDKYGNVYGRLYDAAIGRTDYTHRVVWRRVYGPIPLDGSGRPLPVDHLCEITLCQRPDHLEAVTRAENTRRRHQRAKRIDRTAHSAKAVQRFDLSGGIRPQ